MNALQILIKARELISSPINWAQRTFGSFNMWSFERTCMSGAMILTDVGAIGLPPTEEGIKASVYLTSAVKKLDPYLIIAEGKGTIPTFNDKHTHRECLHAYDIGIANASKDYRLRLVCDSGNDAWNQAVSSQYSETKDEERVRAVG